MKVRCLGARQGCESCPHYADHDYNFTCEFGLAWCKDRPAVCLTHQERQEIAQTIMESLRGEA